MLVCVLVSRGLAWLCPGVSWFGMCVSWYIVVWCVCVYGLVCLCPGVCLVWRFGVLVYFWFGLVFFLFTPDMVILWLSYGYLNVYMVIQWLSSGYLMVIHLAVMVILWLSYGYLMVIRLVSGYLMVILWLSYGYLCPTQILQGIHHAPPKYYRT